jgi:hypothetical protein
MTFGQKYELKKFIWIVLLVLNSQQSRWLKHEDKPKPMLRAMATTTKLLLFRGEDDTKKSPSGKMQLKLLYILCGNKRRRIMTNNLFFWGQTEKCD